jgi:hypothetical protein
VAVRLQDDVLAEDQRRSGLLRSLAVSLAFLWTVDAAEADTFRVLVLQDLDRLAVSYPDYVTAEVRRVFSNSEATREDQFVFPSGLS